MYFYSYLNGSLYSVCIHPLITYHVVVYYYDQTTIYENPLELGCVDNYGFESSTSYTCIGTISIMKYFTICVRTRPPSNNQAMHAMLYRILEVEMLSVQQILHYMCATPSSIAVLNTSQQASCVSNNINIKVLFC